MRVPEKARRPAMALTAIALLVLAGATPALLAQTAAWANEAPAPTLTIGLIPEMNVFEQVARYQLLAEFLAKSLGRPVELTMLSRYGNIIDRMVNKEIDAAFLGSFTGALASVQLEMVPIARPINLDGSSTYWGYIFVRRDSGIESVEQMRGTRIALVEKATTAGYVFPSAWLKGLGVENLEEFFGEVQFWGSHDASIQAVLEGRADVGAAKNTLWEHLSASDERIESELRILATSPQVPSNGLLLSRDLPENLGRRISEILVGLADDPAGADVLARLRARGFVPTDRDSYAAVFALAEEAGIDLATYEYENK